jgi:hypothetical protein
MRTTDALRWIGVAAVGGVVSFYLTGAYLRWAWNRAMEEAP